MKTIIIRRPFVTKSQKRKAYENIVWAYAHVTLADCKDATIETTVNELEKAARYLKKAAKQLGFRSIEDMERYVKIHGTV